VGAGAFPERKNVGVNLWAEVVSAAREGEYTTAEILATPMICVVIGRKHSGWLLVRRTFELLSGQGSRHDVDHHRRRCEAD